MSLSSTIRTPERTHDQRMAALAHANEIRVYRAKVKGELHAGRIDFVDLFDDPKLGSAKVVEFLLVIPKVGKVKAFKLLQVARMSPSKTFGGSTYRQRDEIAALLGTPKRAGREELAA